MPLRVRVEPVPARPLVEEGPRPMSLAARVQGGAAPADPEPELRAQVVPGAPAEGPARAEVPAAAAVDRVEGPVPCQLAAIPSRAVQLREALPVGPEWLDLGEQPGGVGARINGHRSAGRGLVGRTVEIANVPDLGSTAVVAVLGVSVGAVPEAGVAGRGPGARPMMRKAVRGVSSRALVAVEDLRRAGGPVPGIGGSGVRTVGLQGAQGPTAVRTEMPGARVSVGSQVRERKGIGARVRVPGPAATVGTAWARVALRGAAMSERRQGPALSEESPHEALAATERADSPSVVVAPKSPARGEVEATAKPVPVVGIGVAVLGSHATAASIAEVREMIGGIAAAVGIEGSCGLARHRHQRSTVGWWEAWRPRRPAGWSIARCLPPTPVPQVPNGRTTVGQTAGPIAEPITGPTVVPLREVFSRARRVSVESRLRVWRGPRRNLKSSSPRQRCGRTARVLPQRSPRWKLRRSATRCGKSDGIGIGEGLRSDAPRPLSRRNPPRYTSTKKSWSKRLGQEWRCGWNAN